MLQQRLSNLTLNMFVFGRPSKTQLLFCFRKLRYEQLWYEQLL